jgi:hypothetical protein
MLARWLQAAWKLTNWAEIGSAVADQPDSKMGEQIRFLTLVLDESDNAN